MLMILAAAGVIAREAGARQSGPPLARVQVINNASVVGTVDVYVDGRRLLDDVPAQTATTYVLVPAGRRTIDFVAGAEVDNARPLWTSQQVMLSGTHHALVAVDRPTGLDVLVQNEARRDAVTVDAEFFFVHDAPDAPVFDLVLLDPRVPNQLEEVVLNNVTYGTVSTYRPLEPRPHDFQISTADNTAEFTRFRFDLGAFGGKTLTFLITGRFDDGSFSIIGYDAEGRLLADVPITTTGRDAPTAQFIHHVPDVDALDVYVDDQRLLDDVAFETATPFLPLPKGRHKIDLVAGAEENNARPLWTRTYTLLSSTNYAFIAIGRHSPPDGAPGLDVLVQAGVRREAASDAVEFFLVHAAPNAGALDIRLLNELNNQVIGLLANNIDIGEAGGYLALPPALHYVEVTSADNRVQFDIFPFYLDAFGGKTLIFLITGLFNEERPSLVAFDAEGHRIVSTHIDIDVVALEEAIVPAAFRLRGNYPNPFHPATAITFDLPEAARVHLEMVDLLGRTVLTTAAQRLEAGAERTLRVEATGLAAGLYLYRVVVETATDTHFQTGRMILKP